MVHGQYGFVEVGDYHPVSVPLRLFRRVIWWIWIVVLPLTINGSDSEPRPHDSREPRDVH